MKIKSLLLVVVTGISINGCSSISNPDQLALSLGKDNSLGEVIFTSRCMYVDAGIQQKYATFNRGLCALYSSRKFIFLDGGERMFGVYQKRPQATVPQERMVDNCQSVTISKPNFLAIKQFNCILKSSPEYPPSARVVIMMLPDLNIGIGISTEKTVQFYDEFLKLGIPKSDEVDYLNIDTSANDYYVPYIPYKK